MKAISFIVCLGLLLFLPNSAIADVQKSKAPDFTIHTIDDEVISLKDEQGKRPIYIVFWATWCPSCLREIPNLKAINDKYGDEIAFVAVNVNRTHSWYKMTTSESKEPVKEYLKDHGIDYKVALDDQNILSRLFNVKGTPTQILIDKDSNIRRVFHGMPSDIIATIDQLIQE